MDRKMKALRWLLAILLMYVLPANAQITLANYAFSTADNASLYSTSGAAQIIGPDEDAMTSDNILLPFPFAFAGGLHYFFNASSNGRIVFSGTNAVNPAELRPFYIAGNAFAGSNASAMGTGPNGQITFHVMGSFPSRRAIISFTNMSISRAAGRDGANFQVALHESTGVIEFVYGTMETNVALGFSNAAFRPSLALTAFNQYLHVNTALHTAATGTVPSYFEAPVGTIAALSSTGSNGCRVYRFSPPPVEAFTNRAISFSNITSGSALATVSHPQSGAVRFFRADSAIGGDFLSPRSELSIGNTQLLVSGIAPAGFYARLFATNGGAISTNFAEGSFVPAAGRSFVSVRNGAWDDAATWGTASGVVPRGGDTVVVRAGDTVFSNTPSFLPPPVFGRLVVEGVFDFGTSASSLTVMGDVQVGSSGRLLAHDLRFRNGNLGSTTGKIIQVLGSITGTGLVDFRFRGALLRLEEGRQVTEHRVECSFASIGTTPVLDQLLVNSTKPIVLATPLTIVQSLTAHMGTIRTNGLLSLDHRLSVTALRPSAVSIFRFARQPLFDGTVQHGIGSNYNVNLSYPLDRAVLVPGDVAVPTAFTVGAELPASGIVNRLLVGSYAGVFTNRRITISDELDLRGYLHTGAAPVVFGPSGRIFYNHGGIETTGEIESGGQLNVFPLMHNRRKRFLTAELNGLVSGVIAVRYVHAEGISSFAAQYTEAGLNFSYWQVRNELTIGLPGVTTSSLRLRATGLPGVVDFTRFGISRISSAAPGAHSAAELGNGEVQGVRTQMSSADINGQFYLCFDAATALPVSWLSFSAAAEDESVALSWKVANEQNNRGYEVQRSNDGRQFRRIGFVAAQGDGNSTQALQYIFHDRLQQSGVHYYRLRQIDKDGRAAYSKVVSVHGHRAALQLPNPLPASFAVGVGSAGRYQLCMTDAAGRLVYHQLLQLPAGGSVLVTRPSLAPGWYQVQLLASGRLYSSSKVLVE
ncbi:MAG: G8 domain-containing protein [Chitinophagaceae bacterium]|nr:G8 domain-containing protein [Chitinophagaceae bacterium]